MTTTTQAAVIEETGGPFTLSEVTLDDIRDDEVLVRVMAAGLCHTDLGAQAGHTGHIFPAVLGHEAAGIVVAVGSSVTRVEAGDQVALTFTSCGACTHCSKGHPAYCTTWVPSNLLNEGRRADGSGTISRPEGPVTGRYFGQSSFAFHSIADERSVVRIDDEIPFEIAAPLGCGIQTGAGAVLNVLDPEAGGTLAVFGTGAVGLSAIMAAALLPLKQVIAVDVVASRLELAHELGAHATIDASKEDVAQRLSEITEGLGLDYAVDSTANSSVTRTITDNLATFGKLAVVGAPPLGTEMTFDISAFLTGRQIVGVTEGDSNPETFIPILSTLYQQGRLPLERIIKTYPVDQINQAAADAAAGRTVKPVLLFS